MSARTARSRASAGQAIGLGWMALTIALPICTVPVTSLAQRVSIGGVGLMDVHGWALLLLPTALVPLYLGHRRHHARLPLALGAAGVAVLLFHLTLDIEGVHYERMHTISSLTGAALLLSGLVANAVQIARWASRRRNDQTVDLADGS